MAITASFINDSIAHSAIEFANYFRKMVGNGVFPDSGTSLQVTNPSGLSLSVAPGTAYASGVMVTVDSAATLTADASASTRVDRLVVHVDQSTPTVDLRIVKGTEGTQTPPSLISSDLVKQLCLAEFTVSTAGISSLRDTRGDSDLCGYVRNILGEIDATGLFNSFQTEFAKVNAQARAQITAIQTEADETIDGFVKGQNQNFIVNGDFRIDQRKGGTAHSCTTGQAYTVDRWVYRIDGTPTAPFSVQQRAFGDPSVNLQPTRAVQITTKSMDTEGMASLAQFIEHGAEKLGGGSVTVSFLAYATTAQKLAVNLRARYTSSDAQNVLADAFDVGNAWQRYSVVFTVPKRLCDEDNNLKMSIFTTWAGTEANERFGTEADNNVANTIYVADVVVNAGSTAIPFSPRHEAEETALCRRYYRKLGLCSLAASPMNTSTRAIKTQMLDFSGMRKAPTVTTTDKAGAIGKASWEQTSGGTSNGHAVSVSSNNDGYALQFVVQPASTSQVQAASIIFGSIAADAEITA